MSFCIVLWIVLQVVVYCRFRDVAQTSDAGAYVSLARDCIAAGTWYPMPGHLFDYGYVFNPGYVNFIIACFRLFGSVESVGIVQILLNIICLCAIMHVTAKVSGNILNAKIAAVCFCLLWSTVIFSTAHLTEVLFTTLLFLSFALLRPGSARLFAAGACMIAAEWVRPVIVVFLPSALIYLFLSKNHRWKSFFMLIAGMGVTWLLIATLALKTCGVTVTSSTTGGVNLIMSFNDDATGGYSDVVFREGKIGDIPDSLHYDCFQKDSAWKARSIEWIHANPGKAIALAPIKFYKLWKREPNLMSTLGETPSGLAELSGAAELKAKLWKMCKALPYYAIILFGIYGIILKRKELRGVWGLCLLPLVLSSLMHMILVGNPRYHYPYMPAVIIFATVPIVRFICQSKSLSRKSHGKSHAT